MFGTRLLTLKRTTLSILAILSLTGLCNSRLAAQQQFQVVSINLVSSTPVATTQSDYTYRVDILNTGSAASGVTATVTMSSPHTIVIGSSDLLFGDIPAGEVVSSSNTVTLRQKRLAPVDPAALSFAFQTGAPNMAPVADAGRNQIALPGHTVRLDGSRSHDRDATIVSYSWTYVRSIPAGLSAPLSDPGAMRPTVLITNAGTYIFQLVVTDDAGATSAPAHVRVRTGPVANAGPAQTVKVGHTVQLDGSASFDPEGLPLTFRWTLSPPPGSQARLSDPTAEKPTLVADVGGAYRAQLVTSNGAISSEADQVEINATTGTTLSCGDLVSGSITAVGQTDQYTFQGQAKEIVTLTLVDTGGFAPGTEAVATVLSPSGQTLVSFPANSQQQVSLSTAGAYAIQVVGSGNTATGQYNVGLDCRNPNSPVIAALGCGALQAGSITKLGQVNQYMFQGQANEFATLTLVDTGGFAAGTEAVATLFAPSGQALVSFPANSQQQVSLSATGTYVIQVVGSGYTATGQYNVGLDCRNPNSPVVAALGCGALQAGSITKLGQVNQYTFQGQANEFATLTLVDTGGFAAGTEAVATLFAPSGQALVSFPANSQQQVSLSATGTYVIQVVGSGYTATGQYNVGLDCRNPNSPVKAVVGCGALDPGSLTALGQVDQYTFQGQANESVTLTLADTGGFAPGTEAVTSLFAPSGPVLVSFPANSQRQVTLTATGTYVIQVVGSGYTGLGQYNVGLVCTITATPVFTPGGGTYTTAQSVKITDATPGASIYYTTNGSTPTTASTKYTGPITVSVTETLKAIAIATGYTQSTVASATYTIRPTVATPVFSPAAGTYTSTQSVRITDATSGATIYYTTNGSTPTTASTKYAGPITVRVTETIKAIGVATGDTQSAVASATYTLIGSPYALAAPASAITTSTATLNAVVNTLGVTGSYVFQYGTSSTSLNTTTAKTALGASTAVVPVSTGLTGLTTKTKYYYRAVVTTAGGTGTGAVLSFTTN